MKYSKAVALSSISTAFATLLLVLGSYIEVLDLSCLFLASLALMMPLAKDYKLGAFLSYIATVILTVLLTGLRLQVIIPFAMFFGLHPLANYFQRKLKINKILATAIKCVWFVGTLYVMYFATKIFASPNPLIEQYIHYVLTIGGVVAFIAYDMAMNTFERAIKNIVLKLKL